VSLYAMQVSFFFILWKKTQSCPPGLAFPTGGSSSSSRTLLPAQLCLFLASQPVPAVVSVTVFTISCCRSQGRGSNVIHCRKDGTWSGSFHLCREMQGQCALPTQLNSHLKLQCAGGYGIGLCASAAPLPRGHGSGGSGADGDGRGGRGWQREGGRKESAVLEVTFSCGLVCLSERLLREAAQGTAFRKREALRGQASCNMLRLPAPRSTSSFTVSLLGQLVSMGSQHTRLRQRHIQSSTYRDRLYLHLLVRFCNVPLLQPHAPTQAARREAGREAQHRDDSGLSRRNRRPAERVLWCDSCLGAVVGACFPPSSWGSWPLCEG